MDADATDPAVAGHGDVGKVLALGLDELPELAGVEMAQRGPGPARLYRRQPLRFRRLAHMPHRVDAAIEPNQPPRALAPLDRRAAEPKHA
jgi:hypothetical protein